VSDVCCVLELRLQQVINLCCGDVCLTNYGTFVSAVCCSVMLGGVPVIGNRLLLAGDGGRKHTVVEVVVVAVGLHLRHCECDTC
jgi:hypothetical protein